MGSPWASSLPLPPLVPRPAARPPEGVAPPVVVEVAEQPRGALRGESGAHQVGVPPRQLTRHGLALGRRRRTQEQPLDDAGGARPQEAPRPPVTARARPGESWESHARTLRVALGRPTARAVSTSRPGAPAPPPRRARRPLACATLPGGARSRPTACSVRLARAQRPRTSIIVTASSLLPRDRRERSASDAVKAPPRGPGAMPPSAGQTVPPGHVDLHRDLTSLLLRYGQGRPGHVQLGFRAKDLGDEEVARARRQRPGRRQPAPPSSRDRTRVGSAACRRTAGGR